MTVENQENRARRGPLLFTVPACGNAAAPLPKQFQLHRKTSEQLGCPGRRRLAPGSRGEINPELSLLELCRKTAAPKLSKVEILVFLFFGLLAVVATLGCFSELFHLLGNAALEQTVRALLTK